MFYVERLCYFFPPWADGTYHRLSIANEMTNNSKMRTTTSTLNDPNSYDVKRRRGPPRLSKFWDVSEAHVSNNR